MGDPTAEFVFEILDTGGTGEGFTVAKETEHDIGAHDGEPLVGVGVVPFSAMGEVLRVEDFGAGERPSFGAAGVGTETGGVAGAREIAHAELSGGQGSLDGSLEVVVVLEALAETAADNCDGAALGRLEGERGRCNHGSDDVGTRVMRTAAGHFMRGEVVGGVVAWFVLVTESGVMGGVVADGIGVDAFCWNEVFVASGPEDALEGETAHGGDAEVVGMTEGGGEDASGGISPRVRFGPRHGIGERVTIEFIMGRVIGAERRAAQEKIGIACDGIAAAFDVVEPGERLEGSYPAEDGVSIGGGSEHDVGERVVTIGEVTVMREPLLADELTGEVAIAKTMDERGIGLAAPGGVGRVGGKTEGVGGGPEGDDGFAGLEKIEHALEGRFIGTTETEKKHHEVRVCEGLGAGE